MGIASCFTQKTNGIFDVLQFSKKLKAQRSLAKDPAEWNNNLSFQDLKRAASAMQVVDDYVERAI